MQIVLAKGIFHYYVKHKYKVKGCFVREQNFGNSWLAISSYNMWAGLAVPKSN